MPFSKISIPRLGRLAGNIWTSGQPSAEQLRQAHASGLKSVVNLCPAGECGWDEAATATALGLNYVAVPIGAAGDLTETAARKLHDALQRSPEPVLVHCASSNRVGALFALKAYYVDGGSPEASLEQGKAAGLGSLDGAVRKIFLTAVPNLQGGQP